MISLAQAILHAYPSSRPTIDFVVSDDGTGQKITYWNSAILGAKPDANQIAAIMVAAQAAQDAAAAEAAADAAERAAVKATRDQLAIDINESIADQAQAQAYIDLAAPTNQQRNDEVLNSARRDKSNEQRWRRLARAVRSLLKST
jgi:hypothetical protein